METRAYWEMTEQERRELAENLIEEMSALWFGRSITAIACWRLKTNCHGKRNPGGSDRTLMKLRTAIITMR